MRWIRLRSYCCRSSQVRLELMVDGEVENWIVIGSNFIQFPGSFGWNDNFVRGPFENEWETSFWPPHKSFNRSGASERLSKLRLKQETMNAKRTACCGRIVDRMQRIFARKCKHDVFQLKLDNNSFISVLLSGWSRDGNEVWNRWFCSWNFAVSSSNFVICSWNFVFGSWNFVFVRETSGIVRKTSWFVRETSWLVRKTSCLFV